MNILIDGIIQPGCQCPWAKQCDIAINRDCYRTLNVNRPFSCAIARGFDVAKTPTDEMIEGEAD